MSRIAIDLGGTNLRAALLDADRITEYKTEPCKAEGTEQEVTDQIVRLCEAVNDGKAEKIGVAVPSVVDYDRGIVYDAVNIPSWHEVHLKEILEKHFGIEAAIDNDVNCFVNGELHFGQGRPYRNLVGITLGTGIGAGIIASGRLYRGFNTGAGEIGCLPYRDADYEHFTSSIFFKAHGTTAHDEALKAKQGDGQSLALWQEFGYHLGRLLQVVLLTYDPEAIIIGGGIAAAANLFEEPMRRSLREGFPYPHEVDRLSIHFSTLKDANLLGAACL